MLAWASNGVARSRQQPAIEQRMQIGEQQQPVGHAVCVGAEGGCDMGCLRHGNDRAATDGAVVPVYGKQFISKALLATSCPDGLHDPFAGVAAVVPTL